MVPKVAQFAFVLADDEKHRPGETLAPLATAHAPHLRQSEVLALIDSPALAQLHLADSVLLLGIATVAHVLDQEGACAWNGQQNLTRPFVGDMRWAHDECCARLSGCQDMDRI